MIWPRAVVPKVRDEFRVKMEEVLRRTKDHELENYQNNGRIKVDEADGL